MRSRVELLGGAISLIAAFLFFFKFTGNITGAAVINGDQISSLILGVVFLIIGILLVAHYYSIKI